VYKISQNTLYTLNTLAHSKWSPFLCNGHIIPLSHSSGISSLIHIDENICFSPSPPNFSNSAGIMSGRGFIMNELLFFNFFSAVSISLLVGASVVS
jgi:hypothetical protein